MSRAAMTARQLAAFALREQLLALQERVRFSPLNTDLLCSAAQRQYIRQHTKERIRNMMVEMLSKLIDQVDRRVP